MGSLEGGDEGSWLGFLAHLSWERERGGNGEGRKEGGMKFWLNEMEGFCLDLRREGGNDGCVWMMFVSKSDPGRHPIVI